MSLCLPRVPCTAWFTGEVVCGVPLQTLQGVLPRRTPTWWFRTMRLDGRCWPMC